MPIDTALIDAVLAPIPGDAPAGRELRYDPRFEQVKDARREDPDLPTGDSAFVRKLGDWPLAIRLARELLEKETKDLQIAAWLTESLFKKDGIVGLASGLSVVHGIIDKYWDGCFPVWDEEDPELRSSPIEWIGTKLDVGVRDISIAQGVTLGVYLVSRSIPTEDEANQSEEREETRKRALKDGKVPPEAVDKEVGLTPKAFYKAAVADADAAITALATLEKKADERFGRDAPSMLKLRNALDEYRRTAQVILNQKLIDDPDPIVEEAISADGTPAVDESGPLSPEPVNAGDAARRIAVSSAFLRKSDPSGPGPYLTLRGLRWGELRASASTGELDPKLLEAPPTAVRSRLKTLLLDGKWPELLEACEAVMATPQGRGWLDLQRYALTACERIGASHDAIATAVRDALRTLLAAIPQLPEMTLMDDTPTANAETREWLADEQLLPPAPPPAPAEEPDAEAPAEDYDGAIVQEALVQEASTARHGGLAAGPRRRPARDPFESAKSEMQQGRSRKAVELLLGELAREQSERGRFLRQVQIAYIMVESGMDAVARPILERLVATIDEKSLEQWEAGPLVAQPMALLVKVMDKAGESGSRDRSALYLRICRLDTMQAMALPVE